MKDYLLKKTFFFYSKIDSNTYESDVSKETFVNKINTKICLLNTQQL